MRSADLPTAPFFREQRKGGKERSKETKMKTALLLRRVETLQK